MKNIYVVFVLLLCMHSMLFAQFSSYTIGTTQIGYDSLYSSKIGKATTPACAVPGSCNGGCAVYTFVGAGNWNIEGNWQSNIIPPVVLKSCTQIIINPAGSNECLLNIPLQIISAGTSLTVMAGKRFRIPGKLEIK